MHTSSIPYPRTPASWLVEYEEEGHTLLLDVQSLKAVVTSVDIGDRALVYLHTGSAFYTTPVGGALLRAEWKKWHEVMRAHHEAREAWSVAVAKEAEDAGTVSV